MIFYEIFLNSPIKKNPFEIDIFLHTIDIEKKNLQYIRILPYVIINKNPLKYLQIKIFNNLK